MNENNMVCEQELNEVSGGVNYPFELIVGRNYTTYVKTGYLALRRDTCYDPKNEIGPLWNGSLVTVQGQPIGNYVLVYVVNATKGDWGVNVTGMSGYVNWTYLH